MGATASRERAIADSQFGSGTPTTWYLGLSTTPPNDDATGFTEPSSGAYARVAVTNNTTNFPAAQTIDGVTQKSNGAKFTFSNPTATWGQIGYYGWFLASTGGAPEYTNPLDAQITVRNGNTPVEFDIGQMIMTFE